MRFRAGLIFFFLALWMSVGCRKPLAPTVDSNIPPETWITAAPQDTITTRDEEGRPVRPDPGPIPFRFHVYWSGSDQDGAVAGFYFAVTETLGANGPPLPGPKPQDYHFTRQTDSVFIFNVLEETNNRQHAFFIYSVDEKGKPDPTPARLVFNSIDRFPPIPVIDLDSRATGFIFRPNMAWDPFNGYTPAPIETTVALRDTFSRLSQVSDIVPMGSVIRFKWHSEQRVADNPAVAYKYKIGEGDEVEFVRVPASVTSTEYNTTDRNRLGPGIKVFTLRAIDQAGGARTSPETTRRFYMNMLPESWFAGPDPLVGQSFYSEERWYNGPANAVKARYKQVGLGGAFNWNIPFPGSLLGVADSTKIMPAYRTPRKTFFEIYTEYNFDNTSQHRHRVYMHTEDDTIQLNSRVVLYGGGFDPDSPYILRITLNDPNVLPGIGTTPVLTGRPLNPGPANGNPIGFRYRIPVLTDSVPELPGNIITFPESQVFPLLDPAVTGNEPHIAGFQGIQTSGRAYAIIRAQDGDGGIDNRIDDPVAYVDSIEKGLIPAMLGGVPNPRLRLRDRILTFYVNRAPYVQPGFLPRNGDVFFERRIRFRFDLATDDDPYQNRQRSVGGVEAGISLKILRWSVVFRGKVTGSSPPRDTTWAPPALRRVTGLGDMTVDIPTFLDFGNIAIDIELCDCAQCEVTPGEGRCRRYPPINVTLQQVSPLSRANRSSNGPGSAGESSRSRTP